jgi:hypothetical protein
MKILEIPHHYLTITEHQSWNNYVPKDEYELSLYGDVVREYDINDDGDTFLYLVSGGTVEYKYHANIDGLHLHKVERTLCF